MEFTTKQAVRAMLLREMKDCPRRKQVTAIVGQRAYTLRRVTLEDGTRLGYVLRVLPAPHSKPAIY